jgi:hypothetical protein
VSDPIQFVDPGDSGRTWRFETDFLASRWTCIWGRGCVGILDEPAEHLGQGCCSVGAELVDDDEAMMISAIGASLDPRRFEHHESIEQGVFADGLTPAGLRNTRVVDGACIFLNRPGFDGGAGCALHLAAIDADEPPHSWKPTVCWQLPVRVDFEPGDDGSETATVRRWSRADWGAEGETMAWLCTDPATTDVADAFVGDRPVVESLETELTALLGREVYVELSTRMARR